MKSKSNLNNNCKKITTIKIFGIFVLYYYSLLQDVLAIQLYHRIFTEYIAHQIIFQLKIVLSLKMILAIVFINVQLCLYIMIIHYKH